MSDPRKLFALNRYSFSLYVCCPLQVRDRSTRETNQQLGLLKQSVVSHLNTTKVLVPVSAVVAAASWAEEKAILGTEPSVPPLPVANLLLGKKQPCNYTLHV